ncbi:MAG: DUF5131 family protein [Prevotella sp.]|nr:DUF5131 family protein [Prevotella sp.]
MGEMWNLWHGCHKKSEGCQHCYVFRRDAEFEKDSNVVTGHPFAQRHLQAGGGYGRDLGHSVFAEAGPTH